MAGERASAYYDCSSFISDVRTFSLTQNKLSIFHLNVRRLKSKYTETEIYLESLENKFDVLAFSETWFSSADDIVHFDGYKCEGVYRKFRLGGGVSLYMKSTLCYELLPEFSHVTDSYECMAVKCCKYLIASVYRPPSGDHGELFQFITKILEFASDIRLHVVLIGDMNINLLLATPYAEQFVEVLNTYNCIN